MNKPKGYDSATPLTQGSKLPAGGYVCLIKGIDSIPSSENAGARVIIHFDIFEGDFKDYYAEKYRSDTSEDKKWKGNYTLWLPDDSGDDKDMRANRILKTFVEAVEESNQGYHWDWDENKWKGKYIGFIMQDKFWSFNGRCGFSPQVNMPVPVQQIREEKFNIPDPYIPNNLTAEYNAWKGIPSDSPEGGFMDIPDGIEADLPFK